MLQVSEGAFVPLSGGERVGEICVGGDELGFEVVKDKEATEEKEKRRREVEKLGAGRFYQPLAHEPGLSQELRGRKENSQLVGSHPSGNSISPSSCAPWSPGFPWCFSTKYGAGWTRCCAEILD